VEAEAEATEEEEEEAEAAEAAVTAAVLGVLRAMVAELLGIDLGCAGGGGEALSPSLALLIPSDVWLLHLGLDSAKLVLLQVPVGCQHGNPKPDPRPCDPRVLP
jgi:hypothetical protein